MLKKAGIFAIFSSLKLVCVILQYILEIKSNYSLITDAYYIMRYTVNNTTEIYTI